MTGPASLPLRLGALAAGLALALSAPATAQQKVGVSGAVNPDVTAMPPGGAARKLVIGQDVVYNERITTTTEGQTQLMFLDESSMTIGPNSDLTIDQFVYDPKSGTGKLAMSATRGLLRYVGGKLSKQDDAVTLRTTTATLAVRGGAFIVNIDSAGNTQAVFVYGKGLTVTGNGGGSQTVTRPGFEITVNGQTQQPSAPGPVPPGQLQQLVAQLDGRSGGSGGASVIPTESVVASSGIGQTISGNFAANIQQALQTLGSAATTLQNQNVNAIQQGANQQPNSVVDCTASHNCSSNTSVGTNTTTGQPVTGTTGTTTNTGPPAVTVNYAGRIKNTNGNGTARGFVDTSSNGDFAYTGGLTNGVFTAATSSLGTISFPLASGSASFQGTSSTLGALTGTSFLSADGTFFYANVTPNSQPNQRLLIYGGMPVNQSFYGQTGATRVFAFGVQPDAALQSNIPFVRSQSGGNLPNATVSPFYVVAPPTTAIGDTSTSSAARGLQASLAINGQASNQQSTIAVTTGQIGTNAAGQPTFNGQLRGSSLQSAAGQPVHIGSSVSTAVDGNGNSFYGGNNAISGFVLDQTPSGAAETTVSGTATSYGFAQPALPAAVPSGVGSNRSTQALSGNFGGLMYTNAQSNPYIVTGGTFISTDAPNNRIQATLAGSAQSASSGVTSVTMQYGGLSGTAGGQAFVDNNTFAAAESQANPQSITVNGTAVQPTGQLYLASSGAAAPPASLLPSGAAYCQCQFLQWGYWGGDLTSGSSSAPRIDSGHINFWVAGSPTPNADLSSLISQSASATYNGHAIGAVFNNGASYTAAGGFTGTYNFGTQTGTWAVNNFDGHSFAASGRAPLTANTYTFSVSQPGVTGTVNGAFYGAKAAETGGSFAVQSSAGLPTYMASGIFAGKQ